MYISHKIRADSISRAEKEIEPSPRLAGGGERERERDTNRMIYAVILRSFGHDENREARSHGSFGYEMRSFVYS